MDAVHINTTRADNFFQGLPEVKLSTVPPENAAGFSIVLDEDEFEAFSLGFQRVRNYVQCLSGVQQLDEFGPSVATHKHFRVHLKKIYGQPSFYKITIFDKET